MSANLAKLGVDGKLISSQVPDLSDRYAMRVGLFSALAGSAPIIPAAITVVITDGYNASGVGAAAYIYDAAVNSSYVTSNPRSSFLDASSRGFRLYPKSVTPYMFGAAGDAVISTNSGTDDTAAWAAYLAFTQARDCGYSDASGSFLIASDLVYSAGLTKHFAGRCVLVAKASTTGGALLKLDAWPDGRWETLVLEGTKGAVTAYGSKTWETGLWLTNGTSSNQFGRISGGNFNAYLVAGAIGNTSASKFGQIKAHDCGSGARSALGGGTMYGLLVTPTVFSTNGSANSNAQSTTLSVDVLPPSWVQTGKYGAMNAAPHLVRLSYSDATTRLHFIQSVDAVNSRINVFPWVNTGKTIVQSQYVFGGAMLVQGSDSNVHKIDHINAQRCGIGYAAASFYGAKLSLLETQDCGCTLLLGSDPSASACYGGDYTVYSEGAMEDVIYLARPAGFTVYNKISMTYNFNPVKCYTVSAPMTALFAPVASVASWSGTIVNSSGNDLVWAQNPLGGDATATQTPEITRPDQQLPLHGDTFTITPTLNTDNHRLFGFNTLTIRIRGTGPGGTPTGTITFPAPAGWTINGGSSNVVYTGLIGGVAQFIYRFDAVAMNVVLTRLPLSLLKYEFSQKGFLSILTGTSRIYAEVPMTLSVIRANLGVAPATTALLVDVNLNGTTVFSTQSRRPTVATSANTSGQVTNPNISTVSAGDYFTVDIDQVDSTMKDLTVQIMGVPS